MIVTQPPKKFRRHPPRPRAVAALRLVSATYQSAASVRLTFDRPVKVAALDVSAITVSDGDGTGTLYQGHGSATQPDPQTVLVPLMGVCMTSGGVTLTASAATGLAAEDDGGTWAGTTDLSLPFP
jgi:hypothetical protein